MSLISTWMGDHMTGVFKSQHRNLFFFNSDIFQVFKNLQFWPKFEKSSIFTKFSNIFNSKIWKIFKFLWNVQISSILSKIWIIIKFDQNFKNLQFLTKFEKSSILVKFSKIFNFDQIFKNLQFLPKFEKSSILAKFSKSSFLD